MSLIFIQCSVGYDLRSLYIVIIYIIDWFQIQNLILLIDAQPDTNTCMISRMHTCIYSCIEYYECVHTHSLIIISYTILQACALLQLRYFNECYPEVASFVSIHYLVFHLLPCFGEGINSSGPSLAVQNTVPFLLVG